MSPEDILTQAIATKVIHDDYLLRQNAVFICMDCGHATPNFNRMCANCESWNGGDDEND